MSCSATHGSGAAPHGPMHRSLPDRVRVSGRLPGVDIPTRLPATRHGSILRTTSPPKCQLDRHVRDGERVDIMNPLKWSSRDQVALVLGAVIGIVFWLAIGFMYDGILTALTPAGSPNAAFHNKTTGGIMLWLATGSALRWAVFGALVGGGLLYTRQLLHE